MDPERLRILVADDHPMLREGVVGLVNRQSDMVVVGEAHDGEEAVRLFESLQPDIVLMDVQMPRMSGLEAIQEIRKIDPGAAVLVLTTYAGDMLATQAIKSGASGYLLKNCIRRDLLDTLRGVSAGKKVVSPEVAQEIALHSGIGPLTPRELRALQFVAEGASNKDIARKLGISVDTVKLDMKSVFEKLDVADRTHAVVVAIRRGYLAV